jgi:hypothetical protein
MFSSKCAMYFNMSLFFIARKIATTQIILAQNFSENNADFELMRYVFLFSILIFLTRKIATAHIILA